MDSLLGLSLDKAEVVREAIELDVWDGDSLKGSANGTSGGRGGSGVRAQEGGSAYRVCRSFLPCL